MKVIPLNNFIQCLKRTRRGVWGVTHVFRAVVYHQLFRCLLFVISVCIRREIINIVWNPNIASSVSSKNTVHRANVCFSYEHATAQPCGRTTTHVF